MKDIGILDGDLLAVHSTKDVRNGQVVVARIENEVTVKRLERKGAIVYLRAENEEFEPLLLIYLNNLILRLKGLQWELFVIMHGCNFFLCYLFKVCIISHLTAISYFSFLASARLVAGLIVGG